MLHLNWKSYIAIFIGAAAGQLFYEWFTPIKFFEILKWYNGWLGQVFTIGVFVVLAVRCYEFLVMSKGPRGREQEK